MRLGESGKDAGVAGCRPFRTNLRRHANRPATSTVTLVLIHGGGATGRFWDRLRRISSAAPLAVDLPGRGARPADLATLTSTRKWRPWWTTSRQRRGEGR